MTFRRLSAAAAGIVTAMMAIVSCKDDDDDIVTLYLNGTLSFSVPQYVNAGSTLKMTSKGITHPEGSPLGVYWRVSPGMDNSDTLDVNFDPVNGSNYSHTLPEDELQTYTVTCGVFASGYSTSTATRYTTAVRGGMDGTGSITFDSDGFGTWDGTATDERDGKEYYTVTIGNREWFKHNLAYSGEIPDEEGNSLGCGIPYMDCEAMTDVFGLYYTHEQAKVACPDGWRLPTMAEWTEMVTAAAASDSSLGLQDAVFEEYETYPGIAGALMGDARFNGTTMWEYWPQVKITNSSRLAMLPTGYAVTATGSANTFDGAREIAAFWTDGTEGTGSETKGLYRYIYVDTPDVYLGSGYGSFAANVRCVRDL